MLAPEHEIDMGDGKTVLYGGGKPLGRGNNCVVFPCMLREEKNGKVDIMEAALKYGDADEDHIKLWKSIPENKNVMVLRAGKVVTSDWRGFSVFICDRMDCDLAHLIFEDREFERMCTYGVAIDILMQICKGLIHLHKHKIIHYDLKPENVLISRINNKIVVKLTDFDCSKESAEGRSSVTSSCRGTPAYMAPEVASTGPIRDQTFRITDAIDVYSFGVLMWVLLHRKQPNNVCNFSTLGNHIGREIVWPLVSGELKVRCEAPPALCKLLESCLSYKDPSSSSSRYGRPNMEQVYKDMEDMCCEDWVAHRIHAYLQIQEGGGNTPEAMKAKIDDLEADNKDLRCKLQEKEKSMGLIYAAKYGDERRVQDLLRSGVDLKVEDQCGWTSLHRAASGGQAEIVKVLADAGADKEKTDQCGFNALHHAASNGHLLVVKVLVEAGMDVNAQSDLGSTALYFAAKAGHTGTVEALIAADADVQLVNRKGDSALHQAAMNGHTDIIKALLEKGANVKIANIDGWTSLQRAVSNGHAPAIETLIKAEAKFNMEDEENRKLLQAAAINGHGFIIGSLKQAGIDVHQVDMYGQSALHWAASMGHVELTRALIEEDANVNGVDDYDRSPLWWAVRKGKFEVAQHLIDAGADKKQILRTMESCALSSALTGGWTGTGMVQVEADVESLPASSSNDNTDSTEQSHAAT